MSTDNAESSTGPSTATASTSGDVISTTPTSGGALEPITVTGPADVVERTPTSTEYLDLVAARRDHYRNRPSQHTTIDDPRLSPEQRSRLVRRRTWATRLASTPLRSGLSGGSTAALYPVLDLWSLALGVTAGVGTGILARRAVKQTRPVTVEVATEAKWAITDYRESLDALLATASDSKSYVSVSWFESRVDEALLAITSPDVVGEDRRKVIEELMEIGARSWALAQLEARHAAVTATVLNPVVEALDEVPEGPDFSELDAVASKVAAETVGFARDMEVDLPVIVTSTGREVTPAAGTSTVCGRCGSVGVTLRGDTALCQSCANYWTTPTTTSALYCTGTGNDGCACSSCRADEAIANSYSEDYPSCSPCDQPVADATTWHHKPAAVSAPGSASATVPPAVVQALANNGLDWDDLTKRCQICQGSAASAYRNDPGACRRCVGTGWQPGTAQFKAVMTVAQLQVEVLFAADGTKTPKTAIDWYDEALVCKGAATPVDGLGLTARRPCSGMHCSACDGTGWQPGTRQYDALIGAVTAEDDPDDDEWY